MKKKDIETLRNQPPGELAKTLKDTRERLRALKFDIAAGKVKNVQEAREAKKKIARIMTFLKGAAIK